MWNRILLVARAHLVGDWVGESGGRLPVAPVLFQASLAALLCGLARGGLGPEAYTLFALSIPLGLTAVALLGELAPLLRSDPAADWMGAQPVRPVELRSARILVMGILLGVLSLGALLPAAALAPSEMAWSGRLLLVGAGLLETFFVAAALLWLQNLFAGRAEGVLVVLQTAVLCLVILGFVLVLGHLVRLDALDSSSGALLGYPPLWFAALLGNPAHPAALPLAAAAIIFSALTLFLAPFPPAPRAQRTRSPLGTLLGPVRSIARRLWLRPGERPSFEFVYEALPAERDFVTRTYPLVGLPLALLLLGADGGSVEGEGLLSILLFAPAIYLPILLLHVPATATPEARWLLDTAPLDPALEAGGARKAVALRFLLPLYLALGAVTWLRADLALAARLTPVAAAVGLVLLRIAWPRFTGNPPLSTAPGELGTAWDEANSGGMIGVAMSMAVLALLTWKLVPDATVAAVILGLALASERLGAGSPRAPRAGTTG